MTDAPKIDTQAPERIWAAPSSVRQWEIGYCTDRMPDDTGTEYLRSDLADARAAAAAQAMREAAANEAGVTWFDSLTEQTSLHQMKAILALPLTDTAALDRLIAERVREAVEGVSKLFEGCASSLVPADYAQGYREALEHVLDAARASKEGRDG